MAKSFNGSRNVTRKIKSGFFAAFGSGAFTNFVFGIMRGLGMAFGFSGVAIAVVIITAIVAHIPFMEPVFRFFGLLR